VLKQYLKTWSHSYPVWLKIGTLTLKPGKTKLSFTYAIAVCVLPFELGRPISRRAPVYGLVLRLMTYMCV